MKSSEVLKYIVDQYSIDIFYNSKRLNSLIMDLITQNIKERNILKIAVNAGIPIKILSANNLDNTDKVLILSQCKLILTEDYGIEDIWAKFAVDCFAYSVDWDIDNKEPDAVLADIVRIMYNS